MLPLKLMTRTLLLLGIQSLLLNSSPLPDAVARVQASKSRAAAQHARVMRVLSTPMQWTPSRMSWWDQPFVSIESAMNESGDGMCSTLYTSIYYHTRMYWCQWELDSQFYVYNMCSCNNGVWRCLHVALSNFDCSEIDGVHDIWTSMKYL